MAEKSFQLAVIGNESAILIFRSLGCETHSVSNAEDAQAKAEELFMANQGDENKTATYAVVFVEEGYYKEFSEDLVERFTKKALPAIIPIPSGSNDGDDFAEKRLRKIVEKAIGSDILG